MPIKDIKEKIMEDALHEKEKIIESAKEDIKKIEIDFHKEMDSIKKGITEHYEQQVDLNEKKILTEARLEANKNILSEKQEIIKDIFNEVVRRIEKLDRKEYSDLMEKLILDNVEYGFETIYIGDQEKSYINQDFIAKINSKLKSQGGKGELKLAEKSLPIKGGVVLGIDNIRKNASIEVILEDIKDNMETRLSQFLFQDEA